MATGHARERHVRRFTCRSRRCSDFFRKAQLVNKHAPPGSFGTLTSKLLLEGCDQHAFLFMQLLQADFLQTTNAVRGATKSNTAAIEADEQAIVEPQLPLWRVLVRSVQRACDEVQTHTHHKPQASTLTASSRCAALASFCDLSSARVSC